ncbi:CDP-alcohol phosphatidyltransferase family protein [Chryseolinea sp. T2]|uniref:CDP-alcohol phosphatidyltransferase family protein n=1 Tax=Chryseolinea sp. T2 TaxID=3129255 RepID=UPI00307725AE
MNLLRYLPNTLTCLNLVCGCLGLLALWRNEPGLVEYYMWAACIFDFFDGFAARLLKVSSPIGKDLDSLADMVTFGVLPSFFMYWMLQQTGASDTIAYAAFLLVVCSALRLAVFNNDATQSDSFRGVPTPANTLFIIGLPHILSLDFVGGGLANVPTVVLIAITVIFSLLLVSRFELFALKFKSFGWADNKLRYSFLILAGILLLIFKQAAISLIILLYIGLSLGSSVFSRSRS